MTAEERELLERAIRDAGAIYDTACIYAAVESILDARKARS